MKRALFLIAILAVGIPPFASTHAATASPDLVSFVSVLPPGEDGFAGIDLATQEVTYGPHFLDQLSMYAALGARRSITEGEIPAYFKDENFGVISDPANVTRIEALTPATTIYRDRFGVPHVYGATTHDVAYGAGYATAEDRLFEADLFRRAARGTLSELLGPSFIEADEVVRRDGYTEAELVQQLERVTTRYGLLGARIATALEAFTEGFNRRVAEDLANPTQLPVEYVGTGNVPQPWRVTDTIAESVLLSRTFGESAGEELRNAGLLAGLRAIYGSADEARRALDDLRWLNDPAAATTVPAAEGRFDFPNTGKPDRAAIALPDHAAANWGRGVDETARVSKLLPLMSGRPASNAILVGPSESTSGHSLQLGDPQVSYAVPQYLMEIGLHGGGYDSEGMTFPGVSSLVLIGHGTDYAWTVTSGISDAVDVRAERLCDPAGGPVDLHSHFYLFDGQCLPMEERAEVIPAKNSAPPVVDPDSPQADAAVITVQRTLHGPVFARDTVDGAPVALVKERAFWGREFDNAAAFGAFNFPDLIRNADDFGNAASNIVVSLNLYYADRDTIAYWHTGRFPVRAQGVDPRLPSWGTGGWEWQGMLPFSQQPHFISRRSDPAARDYTYNWNNKPAVGWDNGDDTNWGEIHRVDALRTQLDSLLAGGGKMTRTDLINVMNSAATVDPRVEKMLPMLDGLVAGSPDPLVAHALDLLRAWQADGPAPGAHRVDRDGDGLDEHGAAIQVWDAWNERLAEDIFYDELGSVRGLLGVPIVDAPGPGGSAYFDGMFNHVLHVLDPSTALPPQHDWLASESPSAVATRALREALASLGAGSVGEMDALTKPVEQIVFSSLGAHPEFSIPWVNRGTWTHIAEVTGRRS